MKLYYDLHIHSALSPCSDDEMTPNNIVNMSLLKELDVIAVTDHNSILNLPSILKVASENDILVLPGIEVQTIEDIHILCYFDCYDNMRSFFDELDSTYLRVKHNVKFGNQLVYDEEDEIVENLPHSLMFSNKLGIGALKSMVEKFNGAFVPAHINKGSYSLISNLGFIPEDLSLKCIEYFDKGKSFETGDYIVLKNSDAHSLENISERENYFEVSKKDTKEIIRYLRGER